MWVALMAVHIDLDRRGALAELVFRNPPHNHLNTEALQALANILEGLDDDPSCRAIVLASEGKIFSAGAELSTARTPSEGASDPVRAFYDQALRIYMAKKPIVAAVQGAAVGAGLGLAIAADFRIATPEARFVANFTKLGYYPGFGLTHTLPRLIGAQRAGLMFLTSRRFRPEDILGWGLIEKIVARNELREAARELAGEIADNAPLPLLAIRRAERGEFVAEVAAAMVREHREQGRLRETEDFAEGVRSVKERRAGRFVGQ